jgi:hypothetical protein
VKSEELRIKNEELRVVASAFFNYQLSILNEE